MAGQNKKPPPKQYPFPRAKTTPITGPAWDISDTVDEAVKKWKAYLRVVGQHPGLDRRRGLVAEEDRKSTRLNSSHVQPSRMPSSA